MKKLSFCLHCLEYQEGELIEKRMKKIDI